MGETPETVHINTDRLREIATTLAQAIERNRATTLGRYQRVDSHNTAITVLVPAAHAQATEFMAKTRQHFLYLMDSHQSYTVDWLRGIADLADSLHQTGEQDFQEIE